MRDAGRTRQGFAVETLFEIEEFAFGTTALQNAIVNGGNAS
jgi:hypothetical protein